MRSAVAVIQQMQSYISGQTGAAGGPEMEEVKARIAKIESDSKDFTKHAHSQSGAGYRGSLADAKNA